MDAFGFYGFGSKWFNSRSRTSRQMRDIASARKGDSSLTIRLTSPHLVSMENMITFVLDRDPASDTACSGGIFMAAKTLDPGDGAMIDALPSVFPAVQGGRGKSRTMKFGATPYQNWTSTTTLSV
ncbi:hypothetical protein [Luteimonas salinilitoris]|uniref:Uncharacterized protein n=1 Tax=Luteimonas salinilitoris TaxID=3237697 RepID=A0ABV4HQ87_9GAMM